MTKYLLILILFLFLPMIEARAGSAVAQSQTNELMQKYSTWSGISSEKLMSKAKEFYINGKQDSAMICYSIVTNRYDTDVDDNTKKICAQAFNNAGYVYLFYYQDYAKSYAYLIRALELSEALNLTDNLPYVYLNLGNMYLVYSDLYHPANPLQKSIDFFKKGLRVAIEMKDWDVYLTLFINLGNIIIHNNSGNGLNAELAEFDKLVIPQNVPKLKYAQLLRKAITHVQKKEFALARQLFLEQIKVNDSPLTPERFEYQALDNVVYTFKAEQNYKEAIVYTTRIDSLAKVWQMRDVEAEACQGLADLYKKMGDNANAEKFRYLYLDQKDSIMTVGRMEEIGEIHFLHELQKVEDQIHDLNTKHHIQQIIIWVIVIVAIIVVAFLIIIIRKNKTLRERNLQLYHNTLALLKQEEIKRKQLEEQAASQKETIKAAAKYQGSALSDGMKEDIAKAIEQVLTIGDDIFDASFSLDNLSEKIGYNSKYVSQVINEYYELNFTTLIGNQRIKEACKRMLDKDNFGNLTLEGISQSVGFKSRNTFNIAFKRVTGLTPSEYQKLSKD